MTTRSLRPADAEAVLEMLLARDVADLGHPDFDLEHLLADWAMPEVDLERDGWLVEGEDGRPDGYALRIDQDLVVAVRPGAEGRGIGTALRKRGEARATEAGVTTLRQVTAGGNDLARRALEDAGYRVLRRYQRMVADLRALPAVADPLPVRPFEPGRDEEAVWRLEQHAFADQVDSVRTTLEGWFAQGPGRVGFDPSLWLLHADEDGLAGVCLCERWEEHEGYVATLAVDARARGRGLGRRLLAAGLDALRAAGMNRAYLNVALGNDPALTLYESVGFTPLWRSERWAKDLLGSLQPLATEMR